MEHLKDPNPTSPHEGRPNPNLKPRNINLKIDCNVH